MLFSPLAWALFAFTVLITIPGALASPGPKKLSRKNNTSTRVTVETYPAMEDGEIVIPPAPRVEPKPKVALDTVAVSQSSVLKKFEEVPASKRAQVMKRMELCQRLFEVSGRAYDYRSMTTEELEHEYTVFQKMKRTLTLRQDSSGLFRAVEPAQASAHQPLPEIEKDPILDAE